MKTLFKIVISLLLMIVIALLGFLAILSIMEYKPSKVQNLLVESETPTQEKIQLGKELTLLSWNIGYGGLGKEMDFFMDGGEMTRPESKSVVNNYLRGIKATISGIEPDIVLLQEVDASSRRSYNIDEREVLGQGFDYSSYALNYSCIFVPVPFPPMGTVYSGLYTMTDDLTMEAAKRIALKCPFAWPVRLFNLKRCLMASYLPIEGSEKKLVVVNLHLEAYTNGDGRIQQTQQLLAFMQEEYDKGNYVIAAGDFNQFMPGSREVYPKTSRDWEPGTMDEGLIPEGWTLLYDLSVPTARSNNQPYDPENPTVQHYSIDGMIISPNVNMISLETVDKGFLYSDHNPVQLRFSLKD